MLAMFPTVYGRMFPTNVWPAYIGTVSGYYGNPDLEVNDWGSLDVTNFSFYHMSNALSLYAVNTTSTATVSGSFFTNCLLGIALIGSGSQYITLNATGCTNLNVPCVLSNSLAEATGSFNSCVFSNITQLIANPCLVGLPRFFRHGFCGFIHGFLVRSNSTGDR
jgi:hypothetical protein